MDNLLDTFNQNFLSKMKIPQNHTLLKILKLSRIDFAKLVDHNICKLNTDKQLVYWMEDHKNLVVDEFMGHKKDEKQRNYGQIIEKEDEKLLDGIGCSYVN